MVRFFLSCNTLKDNYALVGFIFHLCDNEKNFTFVIGSVFTCWMFMKINRTCLSSKAARKGL